MCHHQTLVLVFHHQPNNVIDKVNSIGKEELEPEGIKFGNLFGDVTIDNLDLAEHWRNDSIESDTDNDDSTSDTSYEDDGSYYLEEENVSA